MEEDTKPEKKFGAVKGLFRDLGRGTLIGLLIKVLMWGGGLLLGAAVFKEALELAGTDVPAWTLLVTGVLATVLAVVVAVLLVRRRRSTAQATLEGKPTTAELEKKVSDLEAEVERRDTYGGHVGDILDHFQRVLADDIEGVSVPQFVERGILQPARDLLATDRSDDIRLSVLLPDDDTLWMPWAAGHNLNSKSKFRLPVKNSLARVVLETGEMQVWEDVTQDSRFEPHPKATRALRGMISCPIRIGDETTAVFNVVSDRVGAFGPAEIAYVAALGAVVNVAVGVFTKENEGAPSPGG